MNPLNFALIGCGAVGRTHARCLADIDGASFVAYADVHEPAARAMLKEFGGRYATSDVNMILADDAIDAVYVCTRHDTHASLAVAAARAGKHVLLEKPVALSLADCLAVADAVRESGVRLMPAFKMRYYPLVRAAREFIPRPTILVGQMLDDRWPDDHWAQDPVTGGANVFSQGCHMTDVLRFLSGSEPTRLWAAGGAITHPGHACIDQCVATIQFDSGAICSWVQGDCGLGPLTGKFFVQLFGDGKSVQLHDRCKKATFHDGRTTWTREVASEEGMELENREFVDAIRNGRPPELSAHDGVQAMRIIIAADRAIRTGQIQDLSGVAAGH